MNWETHTRFGPHKPGIDANINHQRQLHAYRLCRRIMLVTFILGISLGISMIGWSNPVYAAPALQIDTLAIIGSSGAELYTTPNGEIVSQLAPGTTMTASGRSEDNLWVVVRGDSGLSGWLKVSEITLFRLEQLPVMLFNTPTPTPIIEAAPTPTELPPTPVPTPEIASTPTVTPIPSPSLSMTSSPTDLPTASVAQTSSSAGGGQSSMIAVVLDGQAALYDQPNGNAIEQLTAGAALMVNGRTNDGGWLAVEIPMGASGWVQASALITAGDVQALPVLDASVSLPVTEPSATAQTQPQQESAIENPPLPSGSDTILATVTVDNSRLNIRGGPSTDFPILGQANNGEQFEVIARNAEATWIEVRTPGVGSGISWLSADYVTLSHPILGISVSTTVIQPTSISPLPAPPSPIAGISDFGCSANQIIKWDAGQNAWICSDDLIILQAKITALEAEVAALKAEISSLKEQVSP